jgi:hypothetical protein
MDCC